MVLSEVWFDVWCGLCVPKRGVWDGDLNESDILFFQSERQFTPSNVIAR